MKLTVVAACLLLGSVVAGAQSMTVDNDIFNRTCNYTASNISAAVFFNGTSTGHRLFPLEYDSYAVWTQTYPWQACFGPGESYDVNAIIQRKKLPCRFSHNSDGTINYWEEHACEAVLKSNCYCFAVNRNVWSFCEPGWGNLDRNSSIKELTCEWAVRGATADGAVKVDRFTVYNNVSSGNYIALAVWPDVDFHFWRLDNGGWSSKPGMFLPRNTYRNGTTITDVEHPEAMGPYTEFCGYFEILPETLKVNGNGYYHSVIPERYIKWSSHGNVTTAAVAPLPFISPGWMHAYKRFWEVTTENNGRDMGTFRRAWDKQSLSSRPRFYGS